MPRPLSKLSFLKLLVPLSAPIVGLLLGGCSTQPDTIPSTQIQPAQMAPTQRAATDAFQQPTDDKAIDRTLAQRFIQPIFDTLDCEHVGIIQAGDTNEHMAQLFYSRDTDHSHSLNQHEFSGSVNGDTDFKEEVFRRIDRNGDGELSGREYSSYVEAALRTIDTDRDAEVSLEEAGLSSTGQPLDAAQHNH